MTDNPPVDVREMRIVHETFRRMFDQAAGLVRANPTPSPGRVTFLADHIDFGLMMLHHHHENEDELMYPILVERAPEEREAIDRIEHQHREVSGAIDAVSSACSAWRSAPGPDTAEALASAMENVNGVLQPHLDEEESVIVPLAARVMTEKEWKLLGERSRESIPKDRMGMAFGMLLDPLDEDDRRYMKAELPLPVRLLFPVLIQRPWNGYKERLLHGT